MNEQQKDRAIGCLVGLAVGDALGQPVEFSGRDAYPQVTDMLSGGTFGLKAGQWTDDTSMALCLAESLINNGFDPFDQLDQYLRWYNYGHNSSTGFCFDIGRGTRNALHRWSNDRTNPLENGGSDEWSSGNGSIMRLAPVVLWTKKYSFTLGDKKSTKFFADSSKTTHANKLCADSCTILGIILSTLIEYDGPNPEQILTQYRFSGDWHKELASIFATEYCEKVRNQIQSDGYVVSTLEAALWCVQQTDNFEDALILAVNLGEDTDTVAAATGQIAGAKYGLSSIPGRWLDVLHDRDMIVETAEKLLKNDEN